MGRTLPPGFRFHPTDIELVLYYLKRKLLGKPLNFKAIADVDLYKYSPWDLPDKSCLRSRDQEWYFFCPRDRKYNCGSRTNRATENGYWKTTGRDRPICNNLQTVGIKKTLVFHLGRAPSGNRTNWVMHEYKLEDKNLSNSGISLDAYVLCKVFEKSGAGPKNGEQYGAPFKEEDWEDDVDENSLVPFLVGHPSPAVVSNKNTVVENSLLDIQDKCGSVLELPRQGASSNISVDNPPLAEDLDIETLMACFGGDNICGGRNATNKDSDPFNSQGNVLGPARMDGNDIFGGLEDICTRAELQAANTPHPANLWEKYVFDQSLLGHDINYLELNDLDYSEYPGLDYLELNDLGCSMEYTRPAI